MRVIAGEFKSRQLKTVSSHLTRPTTDKNKENIFNMIGPYFDGGVCLDLFGGSGGLGIEALSRGMEKLYTVDKQYKAYQVIKENFQLLHLEKRAQVFKMDYRKALEKFYQEKLKFDLVFLDPPYGLKINQGILDYLHEHQMLASSCMIVIEDLKEEILKLNPPFSVIKENNYGITTIQIIKYEV
jgi:16S rRNA (guanine966-N2)-methyltransferase